MTTADEGCPHGTGHPWCLPSCEGAPPHLRAVDGAGHTVDRRRPLRDLAQQQLQELDDATRVSLVTYWASVAPAAFLLACEAFEEDTR